VAARASIQGLAEQLLVPSAVRAWLIGREEPAALLRWILRESAQLRLEKARAVILWSLKWQILRRQPEVRLLPLARRIQMVESAQMTLASVRLAFLAVRLTSAIGRWVLPRPGYWWSAEEVLPWLGLLAGSVSERES
jgi:hypothetical protein